MANCYQTQEPAEEQRSAGGELLARALDQRMRTHLEPRWLTQRVKHATTTQVTETQRQPSESIVYNAAGAVFGTLLRSKGHASRFFLFLRGRWRRCLEEGMF